MERETTQRQMKDLTKSLIIIAVIGGVFVVGVSYVIKLLFFSNEPEIRKVVEKVIEEKEVVLRAPKCEQTFEEYQKLVQNNQSVQVDQNHNTYAENGVLVETKRVTVSRGGTGEIACGYLYIKAHTSRGALDEKYDSIYINPQEFGGHILRPRGIKIEQEKASTRVLFPLQEVVYLPTVPYNPESQNFRIADWVKVLNVTQETKFTLGLSIEDVGATIDEVRIAYRCWDSQTGKETTGCQLGVK